MSYQPEQNYLNDDGKDIIDVLVDLSESKYVSRDTVNNLYKQFQSKNVNHYDIVNYYKLPSITGDNCDASFLAPSCYWDGVDTIMRGRIFPYQLIRKYNQSKEEYHRSLDVVWNLYDCEINLDSIATPVIDYYSENEIYLRLCFYNNRVSLTIPVHDVWKDQQQLQRRISGRLWTFFRKFVGSLPVSEQQAINLYWSSYFKQQREETTPSIFERDPVYKHINHHCHVNIINGFPIIMFVDQSTEVLDILHGEQYLKHVPFAYAYFKRFYNFLINQKP